MKTNHYQSNEQKCLTWASRPLCGLALCVVALCTGCKENAQIAAAADLNPIGVYTLESVDGKKVPCAVKHQRKDEFELTVKSGAFVINSDGTCNSKVVFFTPGGNDTTREVNATYTCSGGKLTMKWEGAGTTTGTVKGDNFKMNNEGIVFAYRK